MPGEVEPDRQPLARVREDRVVDRVVDDARADLADRAAAAFADQQRVGEERIPGDRPPDRGTAR